MNRLGGATGTLTPMRPLFPSNRLPERSWPLEDLVGGLPCPWPVSVHLSWDRTALCATTCQNVPSSLLEPAPPNLPLWKGSCWEWFLAGPQAYLELQWNANGQLRALLFVPQTTFASWKAADARRADFDPSQPGTDLLGGFQDALRREDPQGPRWAFPLPPPEQTLHLSWALQEDGTTDFRTRLRLPWELLDGLLSLPRPRIGALIPQNLFWLHPLPLLGQPHTAVWALQAHGIPDCHQPGRFPLWRLEGE